MMMEGQGPYHLELEPEPSALDEGTGDAVYEGGAGDAPRNIILHREPQGIKMIDVVFIIGIALIDLYF